MLKVAGRRMRDKGLRDETISRLPLGGGSCSLVWMPLLGKLHTLGQKKLG
jgi:hypothetical protein